MRSTVLMHKLSEWIVIRGQQHRSIQLNYAILIPSAAGRHWVGFHLKVDRFSLCQVGHWGSNQPLVDTSHFLSDEKIKDNHTVVAITLLYTVRTSKIMFWFTFDDKTFKISHWRSSLLILFCEYSLPSVFSICFLVYVSNLDLHLSSCQSCWGCRNFSFSSCFPYGQFEATFFRFLPIYVIISSKISKILSN